MTSHRTDRTSRAAGDDRRDDARAALDGAVAALRRNALPIAGVLAAGAAAVGGFLLARGRRGDAPAAGHPAPELASDDRPAPSDRADPHFRPDMSAPLSAADRAALAPPPPLEPALPRD